MPSKHYFGPSEQIRRTFLQMTQVKSLASLTCQKNKISCVRMLGLLHVFDNIFDCWRGEGKDKDKDELHQ